MPAAADALFSVAGQVVLVSGASRGIGRAIAQGFARRGARVIITGREQQTLAATAAEIAAPDGPAVRGLVCDVADAAAVRRLAETVAAEFGHVDTLINVAGVNRRKPAEDYSEADYVIADTVEEVARAKGVLPIQVALAWMLRQPDVAAPIVSVTRREQLDQLLTGMTVELSDADVQALEAPYQPHPIRGHS